MPNHYRANLTFHRPKQNLSRPNPRFVHIDMWVGPVAGDDGRVVDHGGCEIGVKVQSHGDWQVWSNFPNPPK